MMKNNKFAKISLLILALALCFGAVFAVSSAAEQTELTPEIISQNIHYNEKFSLMYAVDANTVTAGESVTLKVFADEALTTCLFEETKANGTYETIKTPSGDKVAYVFITKGVAYNKMATNYYVQATVGNNESAVKRYSVAEYFYEKLSTATEETDINFYNSALEFGANAEIYTGAKTAASADLITNLRYVVVEKGLLDGAYTSGLYAPGTKLSLSVTDGTTPKWSYIAYGADGAEIDKKTAQETVTVPTDAKRMFVTSGSIVVYRKEVLDFENKNAGDKYTSAWGWISGEGTLEFADEEGHGTVGKYSLIAGGASNKLVFDSGSASVFNVANLVDKDSAKAFEFSFDLKMEFPEGTTEALYINPNLETSSRTHRLGLFQGYTNGHDYYGNASGVSTDKLFIAHDGDRSWQPYSICENVDPTDWFHAKIVAYEGDTRLYVYINGSVEPTYVLELAQSVFTGDISAIEKVSFTGTAGAVFYIDNLFVGFTDEANPNPPAATTE